MARREILTIGVSVLRERAREVTLAELASARVQALTDDSDHATFEARARKLVARVGP